MEGRTGGEEKEGRMEEEGSNALFLKKCGMVWGPSPSIVKGILQKEKRRKCFTIGLLCNLS